MTFIIPAAMNKTIIEIYDFLASHRRLCLLSLAVMTALMFVVTLRLRFKEDIADFLPLDSQRQEALAVYQDVSGANKILAIFQRRDTFGSDPDIVVEAIEEFAAVIADLDSAQMVRNLTTQYDLSKWSEVTDFAYTHIPYFLTAEDYERIDSLLASPGFVSERLNEDLRLLMFPTAGLLSANLQKDPLNLFSPVVSRLGGQNRGGSIELYDGHIFTPDMSRAVVLMESPFGNSETRENARLASLLQEAADSVQMANPDVSVHFIGGPTIAVGNAERIRRDSMLSIAVAMVLIVALLVLVFRKLLNILLIVVSVAWGWLFAVALLSVFCDSVSLIVMGISSIILGIAVNYPLHLIAHTAHSGSMRQVLKEIISPLVIGNITTVGAFAALMPLKAAALRDLGVFAALILIGTILFVIVYLPHVASFNKPSGGKSFKALDWLSDVRLEKHRWLTTCVLLLTLLFAYFSAQTEFDADMSHINYMTEEQKSDMEYFKQFTSGESQGIQNLYVAVSGTTIEEALQKNEQIQPSLKSVADEYGDCTMEICSNIVPSVSGQRERLKRWNRFVESHSDSLKVRLSAEAARLGFRPDAFDGFFDILNAGYVPLDYTEFAPISQITSGYMSASPEAGAYRIVTIIKAPETHLNEIKEKINEDSRCLCFDVRGLNGAMANGLSDNFNYIGWACGLIVFFFLWFSFGSIELALLAFLPMAISWIWIMGIMGMLDIQFNIVNVILATFIFGQGDDYTIFITEGCCYEYAYRRKMLASFKRSIIVSALIMFIGIGTLILAKHPALHSLAQVTVIGMASVVLMAWLLPPVVFNWITRSQGGYRRRPLTLAPILRACFCGALWLSLLCLSFVLRGVLLVSGRRTRGTRLVFRRYVSWSHRLCLRLTPGVEMRVHNPCVERLDKPCVIVCDHLSLLESMLLVAWSPKIIIVANDMSCLSPAERLVFKGLGFYTINQSGLALSPETTLDCGMEKLKKAVREGYSIALLSDRSRGVKSSAPKCDEAPFCLATALGIDILPVSLHGANHLVPNSVFACYSGEVDIHVGARVVPGGELWSDDCRLMARQVYVRLTEVRDELCQKHETAAFFKSFVVDRYKYKGSEILNEVKMNLKKHDNYAGVVDKAQPDIIVVRNCGYGELPLLLALVHSSSRVYAYDDDDDKIEVARHAASGVVCNIEYNASVNLSVEKYNMTTYDLDEIQ